MAPDMLKVGTIVHVGRSGSISGPPCAPAVVVNAMGPCVSRLDGGESFTGPLPFGHGPNYWHRMEDCNS